MPYTTLISADELARHVNDPGWILIDSRHDLMNPDAGKAAYDAGHLPSAFFAHLDTDLSDKSLGPNGEFRGRHPLPAQETFIETLRRWGVDDDSQVIAYDAHGGMFAARLWWMLRWVGHEAVAVLDGGVPAWKGARHELTQAVPTSHEGSITLRPPLVSTVNADDLVANFATKQLTVIDARAPDRFRGENESLDPVGGHIPGAKNRFFKDNLQANGLFKPAEQLAAEFNLLIESPEKAVMQCGSGVTACHNLLALEVAALRGSGLYPGSWSEWCSDSNRPFATGTE
jgi:thiosulfate/3-mercaptopyruvate sulfurtransferase